MKRLIFILIMFLCVICISTSAIAEFDINIRQSFNINSNNEIDSGEPIYELRVGWGPFYGFYSQEKEGRIRWGGQHGGPITSQGFGLGLQHKFKKDRLSFIPWCQLGVYEIDAELEDAFTHPNYEGSGKKITSHWEALYLKQNKIVGYQNTKYFHTYKMEFVTKGPTYGISAGFDIDYRVWKKMSFFMGVGYTWMQIRYHIWGYNGVELDTTQRYWSTEETLDLSYMTGSIGIRIRF